MATRTSRNSRANRNRDRFAPPPTASTTPPLTAPVPTGGRPGGGMSNQDWVTPNQIGGSMYGVAGPHGFRVGHHHIPDPYAGVTNAGAIGYLNPNFIYSGIDAHDKIIKRAFGDRHRNFQFHTDPTTGLLTDVTEKGNLKQRLRQRGAEHVGKRMKAIQKKQYAINRYIMGNSAYEDPTSKQVIYAGASSALDPAHGGLGWDPKLVTLTPFQRWLNEQVRKKGIEAATPYAGRVPGVPLDLTNWPGFGGALTGQPPTPARKKKKKGRPSSSPTSPTTPTTPTNIYA